jgi:DNA-binding winged helix-turn-helix (wHTH) protein
MTKFQRHPKTTELIDTLAAMEYRSVIEHADLMKFIGVSSKSMKYYRTMRAVNKDLTERGKLLRSIPNVGYEVVHPDEWIDVAGEQVKRAHRSVRKADKIVVNAPEDKMTANGLSRFRIVNDRIRSMAALVAREKKDVFSIMGSTKNGNRTFERLPPPR